MPLALIDPIAGFTLQVTAAEKLVAVNSCVELNGTVVEVVVTVAAPADGVGVGVGAGALDPPPQPITHINIAQPSRTPKILDIMPNPFNKKPSPRRYSASGKWILPLL